MYDADGNEVFITLMCLKCQKIRPLSQFGLRRMADGAIRNQPWCRTCRSAPAAREDPVEARRKEPPASGDSPVSGEPQPTAAEAPAPAERARPRSVAAEVAAALAAGRGRLGLTTRTVSSFNRPGFAAPLPSGSSPGALLPAVR